MTGLKFGDFMTAEAAPRMRFAASPTCRFAARLGRGEKAGVGEDRTVIVDDRHGARDAWPSGD